MCACVRVCLRSCVRSCICVCARVRVRVCAHVCVSTPENLCEIVVLYEEDRVEDMLCQVLYMEPCYLLGGIPPPINVIGIDHTFFRHNYRLFYRATCLPVVKYITVLYCFVCRHCYNAVITI